MNAYINLYTNNPTAGGTDGTLVSTDNTETSPISVNLDASQNESKIVKCAIRCESGYEAQAGTVISATGTTAGKWTFALDNDYADADAAASAVYASQITINEVIGTTNKIFWAKASSSSDENPGNDITVNIYCKATIAPTT